MNPFVVNYFLSVFSFFLSENTFKKTMFRFFKHRRTAFSSFLRCVTFSLLSSATVPKWTKGRKEWILRAEATKGLNRMRRHFSLLPSHSPGKWDSRRQLACPQFPARLTKFFCPAPHSQPRNPSLGMAVCPGHLVLWVFTCAAYFQFFPLPTPQ